MTSLPKRKFIIKKVTKINGNLSAEFSTLARTSEPDLGATEETGLQNQEINTKTLKNLTEILPSYSTDSSLAEKSAKTKSDLVKIGDAARILGVSVDTVRRWVASGKIYSFRTHGGTRVFEKTKLEEFINNHDSSNLSNTTANLIGIREAAEKLGVSIKTLRRWDKNGKLKATRGDNGERVYNSDNIQNDINQSNTETANNSSSPLNITANQPITVSKSSAYTINPILFKFTLISIVITVLLTGIITTGYFTAPQQTLRLAQGKLFTSQDANQEGQVLGASSSENPFISGISSAVSAILSPFNQLSQKVIQKTQPGVATQLGFPEQETKQDLKIAEIENQNKELLSKFSENSAHINEMNTTFTSSLATINSISNPQDILTTTFNLVRNSSFEANPSGQPTAWNYINQSSSTNTFVNNTSVRSGNTALKIQPSGSDTSFGIYQPSALTSANHSYTLSLYVRNELDSDSRPTLRLTFWDRQNNRRAISEEFVLENIQDWRRYSFTLDPPNQGVDGNGYYPMIEILNINSGSTGNLYLDDINLSEGTGTSTYDQENLTIGDGSIIIDSNANIYPTTIRTGSIGTTLNPFSSMYLTNSSIDSGGNASFGGTLNVTGNTTLSGTTTINNSSTISLPNGSAATPALNFTNNTNAGLYRLGANSIGLITNGSSTSGITVNSGSVGIGTTTPGYMLDVAGTFNISGAATFGSTLGVTGVTTLTDTLTANGAVNLGDSTSDNITATGRFASSLIPSADNTYDLGTSALKFNNLYVNGISSSGQQVLTYVPTGTGVNQGTLYLNPASATADYTMLGIAINGTQVTRFDSDGDITTTGDIAANGGDITSTGTLAITPTTTLTLNSTGDLTLDSSTDVIIDAAGSDIIYKENGTTFLTISDNTTDATLTPAGGDLGISGTLDVSGHSAFGNNASVNSNYTVSIGETVTNTSGSIFGLSAQLTANPATTSSASYITLDYAANTQSGTARTYNGYLAAGAYAASHYGTGYLANAIGGWSFVTNESTGTINAGSGYIVDVYNKNAASVINTLNGYAFVVSDNTGSIGTVNGFYIDAAAGASNSVTNYYGGVITAVSKGSTINAGLVIAEAANGKNTNLLIGTTTIPTGSFSIYNSSADNNYFAGKLGIADTSPTNALTVTGAASISSYLQIGSETATTYSRFGTGTTGHTLSGADALLITGAFEVDGAGYFDSTLDVASTLTANTFASSGATITGGTINGTVIGGVTPAAGTFTTLVGTTINGNTVTTGTGTLTLGAGKTLTASDTTTLATNSITFGGTEILTLAAAKNVTFADAFATSGAFGITLTATGTTGVTLPTTGTLSTLAGIESLSNKTLVSPVITTSPTAAGATWTDLGIVTTADINGGTIDGVTIGGSTAAAGTFTTLTATGNVQLGDNVADTLTVYPTTLAFLKENAHTIQIADSTSTNTAGSTLTIKGATGNGNGNGGAISLTGGAGNIAAGGAINITGGNSSTGSVAAGGALVLAGGIGGGGGAAGTGGAISITSGASIDPANGGSGTVTIQTGNGPNSSGASVGGSSGAVTIQNGTAGTSALSTGGSTGLISLISRAGGAAGQSGTGTGGNSGGLSFTPGAGGSSNNGGAEAISGGNAGSFTVVASAGGNATLTGNGGTGSSFTVTAGNGGTTVTGTGGTAGAITFIAGNGGVPSGAGTGRAGGAIGLTAGNGSLALAGGAVSITAGQGGATAAGGAISLTTGAGGSSSGTSGALNLLTGAAASGAQSGIATLRSGNTTAANSGATTISTGTTTTSGVTGALTLSTGNSAGNSGAITIDPGTSASTVGSLLIGNTNARTITIGSSSATDVSITDDSWSITTAGAGALDSLTVGGGYGSTGVTISNAGVIQADGAVTFASDLDVQGNTTLGNLNTADTLTGNLLTSAITSGATTQTAFSVAGTGFTTGELLDLTGTFAPADGTTNEAIDINITHTPTVSADNFQSFNLTTTDGTALGNTVYNQQNTLTLTGNAAKTGIGVYSTVTSSSTTADTLYAGQFATTATGALSTGTRSVYGINSAPASTAASTGGTLNLYGSYLAPTSTLSNPGVTDTTANNVYGQYITTTATLAADCTTNCTTNQYGLYVANGTSSTNGTSTKYGLYVESPTGADTNYAAIFAGGNVGIGATAPSEKLVVSGNIVSGTNITTHTQLYSSYDSQSPSILEVGYGTATANSTPFPILVLSKNLTGTSNLVGAISFANSSIADGNDKRTGGIYSETSGAANSGTLQFYTSSLGTHAEKARITPGGNIGIGTTAPDAALEINHATGDSLRLTYNDSNGSATNYTDFSLSSTGALTLTGSAATLGASATAEKTYLTLTPGVITLTAPTQVTSLMETAVLTGATIAADAATTVDKATTLSLVAPIDSTNATLTASSALRVLNVTSGAGTLTNQYGLYIEALTAGTNDYGIYVADADTGSLVLASDDGDAASGITFGTTNSANLYKSAADTLKTDDNFIVGTDLTVSGGDITGANGESIDIGEASNGTISLLIDATSGLNVGSTGISSIGNVAHTIVNSSGALNIDSATTGAINIGTGANAKTITIGNNTTSTALAFTSGTGSQTFTSSVATTGTTSSAFVFTDNALTTGTGMYLNSTSMTTGTLLGLSATAITSGKFLDISNGSSIFSISNTDVTTSLPVNFTSSGDVSIAYDINMTNPTASYIKSSAPLYIQAGPSYANNDLTLQTFGTGSVIVSQSIATTGSPTAFNVTGAAHTTLTASTEATDINFNLNRTVQFAQGALTTQRAIQIQAPTYGFATGASTLTTATTLDIGAAPTAGTNATITNSSALRVGATGTSLASVAGLNYQAINIPAHTLTVTGTTQVTSSTTAALGIGQLTITDASAVTYDNASSLYISAAPIAGGSVTLTNKYALWVDAGTTRLDGALAFGSQQTFTDSDATPDVSTTSHWKTNTSGVTITDFDAGSGTLATGHIIFIESDGAIVYDCSSNAEFNCGGADITTAAGDITSWIYDGTAWNLINWMKTASSQTGADVAEWYVSSDSLEPGDLVSINPTESVVVQKSQGSYDQKVLGIVTTSPGIVLGVEQQHTYPIALVGRVPLKVSNENGPVEIGDYLTSSSIPGVAMKATKSGQVIGKALESYNSGGIGKVMTFINVSYADPSNFLASLSLDELGNLIAPQIKTENIVISTTIDISRNDGKGLLSYASSTNTANQPTYEVDVISSLKNLETAVINTQDKQATDSAKLADLEASTSTQSAALADLRSQVASLAGQIATSSATTPNDVADLNLTPPDLLIATGSATLADLKVTSQATFSGVLTAYDLSVQNTFKSLGGATLGNTNIAGDLTVDGTFSITQNSINAIGYTSEVKNCSYTSEVGCSGILYLQNSPLAQGIDIFNGLITIDNTGKLTAQTVSATEYLGVSGSTVGTGKIVAGTKTLTISSTLVKTNSRILVTPTSETSQPISVVAKTANTSFTVSMPFTTTTDINFDWFIINESQ